jgi:hypothetical protein
MTQTRPTLGRLSFLPFVAALLWAPALPGAEGTFLEKEVAVPRTEKVQVDLSFQKATLLWVESQNDPQDKDVKEAADKDPKDKTWMLIRFHYRNDDYLKHHVQLRVVLLGEKGEVLGEAGRSGTLDSQQKDDTLSFPMRVKTVDWPKAAKLKILATFLD